MSDLPRWPSERSFSRRFSFYALIWLAYLIYPLLSLLGMHAPLRIAVGALALVLFVAVYVSTFTLRPPPDRRIFWAAAAIELIALVSASYLGVPFLGLAVYVPVVLARLRSARMALLAVGLAAGLMVTVGRAVGTPLGELLSLTLVSVLSSVALRGFLRFIESTFALRRAQEEIAQLAKLEERGRIARDLHDILGHSLSLVVLKSELSQTLLDRGDVREAGREIEELQSVARAALAEVREAVADYRKPTLSSEILRAPTVLATAGIECDVEGDLPSLTDEQDSALALVLREAVTNVVRHSAARRCRIRLTRLHGAIRLEVQDDGRASETVTPGNGLAGMAERVQSVGGQVAWRGGHGFTLVASLPEPA